MQGDSADLDDLDRLFETVKREKGTIDVLWASAGVGEQGKLGEITPEQFDAAFSLNARGTLFTVQKALPLFKRWRLDLHDRVERVAAGLPPIGLCTLGARPCCPPTHGCGCPS